MVEHGHCRRSDEAIVLYSNIAMLNVNWYLALGYQVVRKKATLPPNGPMCIP